jgi:ribosomal protein S18 acetylase RimI-like enzyme
MQILRLIEQDFDSATSIAELTDEQKLFLQIQSQLMLDEEDYSEFENIDPTLIQMLLDEMEGTEKLKIVDDTSPDKPVIGVATLKRTNSVTKIETLVIERAARNRKLGEQALNLITSLVSGSCSSITLNPANTAAARFYDNNGFVFDYSDTSSHLGTMVKNI